jgi:hypothetical protein
LTKELKMAKKIALAVTAAVLLVAAVPIISGFAAEKAKETKAVEKPEKQAAVAEKPNRPGELLDQLIAAYEANDRAKMGEIIKQMQQRREKMREFAKFNKWHQMAHRQMMGQPCPGQWQRGPCCGNIPMNQGWGPPPGDFRYGPCDSPRVRPMREWRPEPGPRGPDRPAAPPADDLPAGDDPSPDEDW